MLNNSEIPIFTTIKKSFIVLTAILLLTALIISCEKEQSPYELAKEHNKLFRCDINGEEWAIMELDYNEDINVYGVKGENGVLTVHAKNNLSKEKYEYMYLLITDRIKVGYNKMADGPRVAFIDFDENPKKEYFIDNSFDNHIYINDIDTVKINGYEGHSANIIATFEFRAITKDKQDTVLVKDGEFDLDVHWRK